MAGYIRRDDGTVLLIEEADHLTVDQGGVAVFWSGEPGEVGSQVVAVISTAHHVTVSVGDKPVANLRGGTPLLG